MSDSFSAELWDSTADTYAAILAHPFVRGLTDGSLSPEAFTFYVVQDALYLRWYAQALAAVASRAPTPRQTEMFARHAADAIAVEKTLHGSLLAGLGAPERDRVHRHFRTTSRYEWMFWDMGYRQEAWPV